MTDKQAQEALEELTTKFGQPIDDSYWHNRDWQHRWDYKVPHEPQHGKNKQFFFNISLSTYSGDSNLEVELQ